MTTTKTQGGKHNRCCWDTKGMPCNFEEFSAMMAQCFGDRQTAKDGKTSMSDCRQTMQAMMGMCCGQKEDRSQKKPTADS